MLVCSSGLLVGLELHPRISFTCQLESTILPEHTKQMFSKGPGKSQHCGNQTAWKKWSFLPWVSRNYLIFLLVKILKCSALRSWAFFLLLGLMLLCHPKSKHQCFCSPQDAFPTFRVSRCHLWVCCLGGICRKPTPHLVIPCGRTDATSDFFLLSETVSFAGCISQLIYLATGKFAHLFVCFHLLVLWWGIWPSGARTVSDYNNYKV